jgi:hypothetical protein
VCRIVRLRYYVECVTLVRFVLRPNVREVASTYHPSGNLTLEYICAFCNSKVFMFIYEQFFGALRMSGGYFQFQAPNSESCQLGLSRRRRRSRS